MSEVATALGPIDSAALNNNVVLAQVHVLLNWPFDHIRADPYSAFAGHPFADPKPFFQHRN